MRGRDQDRLAGPDVEPHAGFAPAWKADGLKTGFVPPGELEIAIVRRDQYGQPPALGVVIIHAARVNRRHGGPA